MTTARKPRDDGGATGFDPVGVVVGWIIRAARDPWSPEMLTAVVFAAGVTIGLLLGVSGRCG